MYTLLIVMEIQNLSLRDFQSRLLEFCYSLTWMLNPMYRIVLKFIELGHNQLHIRIFYRVCSNYNAACDCYLILLSRGIFFLALGTNDPQVEVFHSYYKSWVRWIFWTSRD